MPEGRTSDAGFKRSGGFPLIGKRPHVGDSWRLSDRAGEVVAGIKRLPGKNGRRTFSAFG